MSFSDLLVTIKPGDWINSIIALATCLAAWFSFRAARAARKQADAAWIQVELQRPRPVVTIEGEWSIENLDVKSQSGFLFRNLGSSPAIDVEVSEIIGPRLRSVGYPERLLTGRIFALSSEPLTATHYQVLPGTTLVEHALARFLLSAAQEGFSAMDLDGNPSLDHRVEFALSYSGVDGRRFHTSCHIRFNLGVNVLRARIAPSSNWLGSQV